VLALVAVPAATGTSEHGVMSPGLATLTAKGVGPIKIGATYASLKAAGLVGKLSPGCELVTPRESGAQLIGAIKGSATFNKKQKLVAITVRKGAETAKHVTIGDSAKSALAKYPGAKYQRASVKDPIPYSSITVISGGNIQFSFLVSAKTQKIVELDVPTAQFCE
jgi:hypothetical protein